MRAIAGQSQSLEGIHAGTASRWWLAGIAVVLFASLGGAAEKRIAIGRAAGRTVTLPVMLSTDEPVQGFTLSIQFGEFICTDVRAAGAARSAELIAPEIFAGGFTLQVVMDVESPASGAGIPPGDGQPIAEVDLIAAALLAPGTAVDSPVVFDDGVAQPPVRTALTVGGQTIGVAEGLVLTSGQVTVPAAEEVVRIASQKGADGQFSIDVPVVAGHESPLEGYSFVVRHPAGIWLERISTEGTDADAIGIEYEVSHIESTSGEIAVIFDALFPRDGQALPRGSDQTIAVFTYGHRLFSSEEPLTPYCLDYDLAFERAAFRQGGVEIAPSAVDGRVTFCGEVEDLPQFFVGADAGRDQPAIVCAQGLAGGEAKVSFYYFSRRWPLQGVSIALCFPPQLQVADLDEAGRGILASRHLEDTVTMAVLAEFVNFNADNAAGELVAGILVDDTPPVDITHMLPPRDPGNLGKLLNVYFDVSEDAAEKECLDLTFCGGIYGAGNVPIYNRAAVFNESFAVRTHDGCLCASQGLEFWVGADDGERVVCATDVAGADAAVSLYYSSTEFPLQGISMGLCFPTELTILDLDANGQGVVSGRHLEGTLTWGLDVEFVSFNADNERGELVVGLLVDATPPVPINHMYPSSITPQKVLRVFFAIPSDARCDTCYDLRFCEGALGAGSVPIYNRAAVYNRSVGAVTHDGCLCVTTSAKFIRGDCNSDRQVDIADPAATMSYLFLNQYSPRCMDACDSNDDGVVDGADPFATLYFLFRLAPELPAPGPYPPGGIDPTLDAGGIDLGCEREPCWNLP